MNLPILDQQSPSQRPLRLWVVMGGISTEHDVSLISGRGVASALAEIDATVRPIIITRDGRWQISRRLIGPRAAFPSDPALFDSIARDAPALACPAALGQLADEAPDCVFIALHGRGGEDGGIQGLLDWLGARYTGSKPSASAIAMDKVRALRFLQTQGFAIAPSVASIDLPIEARLEVDEHVSALAALARQRLAPPVFVKPCLGGSSLGIARIEQMLDLEAAIAEALATADEALIEQAIAGREVTCGVLDLERQGGKPTPTALAVTEIRPKSARFFDFAAKYEPAATEEITPASIEAAQTEAVQCLARRAHTLIGCRGMSRSDFILADDGEAVFLEINTIPGMTPTSLLPQGAAPLGLSYRDVCEAIVAEAIGRRS